MAIVHVAAVTKFADKDNAGRYQGTFSMMGTWIDECQETGPWDRTLGKPTYHHGVKYIYDGGSYSKQELYREVFPWLPNTRHE